jgi:hypothetical protein
MNYIGVLISINQLMIARILPLPSKGVPESDHSLHQAHIVSLNLNMYISWMIKQKFCILVVLLCRFRHFRLYGGVEDEKPLDSKFASVYIGREIIWIYHIYFIKIFLSIALKKIEPPKILIFSIGCFGKKSEEMNTLILKLKKLFGATHGTF